MPSAVSFQGSNVASLLFTAICPSPSLLQGHVFHLLWEAGSSEVPGLKTKRAHLAFHRGKHFGMQGLLPNAATPTPSNIPAWEMRFFLPKARAQTRLWMSHTRSGAPKGLRNPHAAFEGRHVRPRHPAPQAAPVCGQHLAAITHSMECKATIPVAEGTGRTNRTLFTH